jgi:ParB family transcriptional regulator, chromosome partitioning protein
LCALAVHQYPNFEEQEHRIPTLLNTALRRLEREKKLAALAEMRLAMPEAQQAWLEQAGFREVEVEEEQLFAVILKLQLNPLSVNSNVFPLLKLADDLKEVIRTEGLESSKARELNRLSADKLHQPEKVTLKIRKAITDKVVREKLSFSATRTLVNQLIQQYNPQTHSSQEDERFVKTVMAIDIASITDTNILRDLKNALKVKLEEVNCALKK